MRPHIRASLIGDNRTIELRPGTVALAVPASGATKTSCFLCTAPTPCLEHAEHAHKDACDAYLVGFVSGVTAMIDGNGRPNLCDKHETQLRELLVVRVQDAKVYDKLDIEYKVT